MSQILRSNNFDIQQIAESGQCFRINCTGQNTWQVIALNRRLVIIKHSDGVHEFHCSQNEFDKVWRDYFDLNTDYTSVAKIAYGDPYLMAAIEYGRGIRILKQDLWEMIVSFVISQQNNIPRIKATINKLCAPYDDKFPTPYDIAQYSIEYLKSLGLGYRADYIYRISHDICDGAFDLQKLKMLNYQDAVLYLLKLRGVGIKVANCVALFGLYKTEAFPIDVWIQRIIDKHYNGVFDYKKFGQYAGIIQQYMYFYERNV